MNKSETIGKLAGALAKFQGEIGAVEMNAKNPFLKNKYADLGAIIKTTKPILVKHGLAVSQLPYNDGDMIGVTTILTHESGEYISESMAIPVSEQRGLSLAQVVGSVITYIRRYQIAAILGVYADEDVDGNDAQPKQTEAKQSAKPESKPKPAEKKPQPSSMKDAELFATETDSKGKLFKDMSIPELAGHVNEYIKRLKENPNDAETLAKKDACQYWIEQKRE